MFSRHTPENTLDRTGPSAAATLAYDKRVEEVRRKARELEQTISRHQRAATRGCDFGHVATMTRVEHLLDGALRALANP